MNYEYLEKYKKIDLEVAIETRYLIGFILAKVDRQLSVMTLS